MSEKRLISISIPVLNEEDNLDALYERLCRLSDGVSDRYDLEFVFTDNHSDDSTWQKLSDLASQDKRVRAIRFSKNFGFQRSILANYMHAQGAAVMQIDADLQDPPEMLEQFLEKWEQGYQVVYGVRRKRPEGFMISMIRRVGYWIIDVLSEHPIPRDVGDFRLVDRKVVDALVEVNSPNPYLRGMIAALGFNETGIPYDRDARIAGESKFNLPRLIGLGLTAVFNHSSVPLRAASFLGGLILAVSFLGAIYYVALKVFDTELPPGFASTQILILFGIGLNSFLLGIIGEYLLRIYKILRNEPIVIVESTLNCSDDDLKHQETESL